MKVLITGNKGFLGQYVQREFEKNGHTVIGFDLPEYDLKEFDHLHYTLSVDAIIHLAAISNHNESHGDKFLNYDLNVTATAELAKMAFVRNIPIYFASTCCVYGNAQPASVDTLPMPLENYAMSKLAAEYAIKSITDKYCIMRLPTFYGPGMRKELFIYQAIDKIYRGIPLTVYGDGSQSRQYSYVENVADRIYSLVERGNPHGIFNLHAINEAHISVITLIKEVEKTLGKKALITFHDLREWDIRFQRMKSPFYGVTSFNEGLQKTIDWYLSEVVPNG